MNAPDEVSWLFVIEPRSDRRGSAPQLGLVPPDDAKPSRGLLPRDERIRAEDGAKQREVVIFAEAFVQRFETALVAREASATPSLDQAHVKPVLLHAPPPRVVVVRSRVFDGDYHRSPGPPKTRFEAVRDGPESSAVEVPLPHPVAFRFQRRPRPLQHTLYLGLAIGPGLALDEPCADGGEDRRRE